MKGSVSLVVNLASFSDLTLQYLDLNALMLKYSNQTFQILGFPCNQFGLEVSFNLSMSEKLHFVES